MTYSVVACDPETGRFGVAVRQVAMVDASGRAVAYTEAFSGSSADLLDRMLAALDAAETSWRELIPRLVAAGVMPELPWFAELLDGSAP